MKNFEFKSDIMAIMLTLMSQCEDTAIDIEKSILDKLGKNEVKFEKDGFTSKLVNG